MLRTCLRFIFIPRTVRWLCLTLLAMLALGPIVDAQLYTGSVSGTVIDASGAVVPGALARRFERGKRYAA